MVGLLPPLVDLRLVEFLVLWFGDCVLPGDWVGDFLVEVLGVEGVLSWVIHYERRVVTRTEVLPICGEGFVFSFKVNLNCICLFSRAVFRAEL